MVIFKTVSSLRIFLNRQKENGIVTGFVPTMGALHEGHISLIKKARTDSEIVICSIFVNPTQFNDPKDFELYPSTTDQDIYLLENGGCDVLFLPSVNEIYPNGPTPSRHYELGFLETVLDGHYRPGHFQGVCQVVHRLLDIVEPAKLYLGQKDYQQCLVLTKLIDILERPIEIVACPTEREPDGLAMSSRNRRLSPTARQQAIAIYKTLTTIKSNIKPGNLDQLKNESSAKLETLGFKPDYVEIADASTLQLLHNWNGQTPLVVLVAAFLDNVRLIDNITIPAVDA